MQYKNIIGKKILVHYADHNIKFETIFPLTGIIAEIIKLDNRNCPVVVFETPFTYNNDEFVKMVIKERHEGVQIGDDGEVHVHVLLPKGKFNKTVYSSSDFNHVVWATIKIL